jgi:hypothetical protein
MLTVNQSTEQSEKTTETAKTRVGTAEHYPHPASALLRKRLQPPDWLTAAVTPACVRTGLLRLVPEFASGRLVLSSCEVKRLRFRESQGCWSGMYLLTIEGLPQASQSGQQDEEQVLQQVVPVHGTLIPPGLREPAHGVNDVPFGAEQWRCYLPELHLELRTQPPDSELAALPQLTDPEAARSLLETSIRAGAPHYDDLRIESCTPKVMRYKPGSRCTILYHLAYPPALAQGHNWPAVVVAKTHHGAKGQNAYAGMQALWNSPLGTSHTVAIAEPLAYLTDLKVLVQGPIREEQTLEDLIQHTWRAAKVPNAARDALEISGDLHTYICKTAAGLAELHQCGIHYGETVNWTDELAEIYEGRAKLAAPLPQLGDLAEDLLDHLQRLAAIHPADPVAPAHRSFRPAQVLLYKGQIGFIDFDGVCQAEPAMDLALFMTTVKNMALRKSNLGTEVLNGRELGGEDEDEEEGELIDAETRLARLTQAEAICQLFLTEYEKHASVSHIRILLWETLDLLSLVLGSWTKLKLARLDNCLFMLERHLKVNGDRMTEHRRTEDS